MNTWPTSRWLGEQLATSNGISSLISFPFPGKRLKQLTNIILGLDQKVQDPWDSSVLIWEIINLIPEVIRDHPRSNLSEWIKQNSSKEGLINKELWQLFREIAIAIDDYALYRPDEIYRSIQKNSGPFPESKNLNSKDTWQEHLISLLSMRLGKQPFGLKAKKAIEELKTNKNTETASLPKELHVFGISTLAPVQIELLQALSGSINITMYILTPCTDLWQRCRNRREELGPLWKDPPDGLWLLQSPRLEAKLGRMGAEFQQLLEGSGESQLGEWKEGDLFSAPINIAKGAGREATLLEQIQQQLVDSEGQRRLNKIGKDTSLIFSSCSGHLRQVQTIRDQILQWLSEDETLEPRDILIMTPQINRFAPLIASAFNDQSTTKVEMPWKITDKSQIELPGITQFTIQLLRLGSKRLSATSLNDLLSNPAIQKHHNINQDDANKISSLLQKTGFRYGLDENDRNGNEVHSLMWCLDRWLLGLVLPQETRHAPDGTAPFSQGITTNELSRWWDVLFLITKHLKEIRHPRNSNKWVDYLKSLLEDLFNKSGALAWEYKAMIEAIESWRDVARGSQIILEADVVADILSESIRADAGRFGHRSGKITISALEPMRAIPHRVIVLMGLDVGIFPRNSNRPSFHLLEQSRRLGDPERSDQDRYAILEALMSARDHLMITWNGRNERTGEHIPASSPIQQWLRELEKELGKDQFQEVIRETPSNPIDRKNFISTRNHNPLSCEQRNLEARELIDQGVSKQSIALAIPLEWDFNFKEKGNGLGYQDLQDWLVAPQANWLRQQQIKPKEWIEDIKDLEDIKLDELRRYQIIKERLDELLREIPCAQNISDLVEDKENWSFQFAGKGILPQKAAGELERELLEKRWKDLKIQLLKFGKLRKEKIELDGSRKVIIWAGDSIAIIEPGQLNNKVVMKGWLQHLQTCSIKEANHSTLIIARKKNSYEIALKLSPINISEAKEKLLKLKRLAENGQKECWPIPPQSGWAIAKSKFKDVKDGYKVFKQSWDGGFKIEGEREKTEMKICFGETQDTSDFLNNKVFQEAFNNLYIPLIENLNS